MMLLFSPCKRCPCPCSVAVLRSCEEALAGIILHRPPFLWFAWVRSGCAGPLGAGPARGPESRGAGRGGGAIPYHSTPNKNDAGALLMRVLRAPRMPGRSQGAQYPLIKEYGLMYKGFILSYYDISYMALFLNFKVYWALWAEEGAEGAEGGEPQAMRGLDSTSSFRLLRPAL